MNNRRRYAAIFAYSPSIGKDRVDTEITKFKEMLNSYNGKIEKSEYLGIKALAYTIKKYDNAHYVQYYFNLENDKNLGHTISELNRKIEINQEVIRHMIMKLESSDDFNFNTLKDYSGFDNQIKI